MLHSRSVDFHLPRISLRSALALLFLPALTLLPAATAQKSNGFTFYHLADASTHDSNGNLLANIHGNPQTDGNVVAFMNSATNTSCDANGRLYSIPITGGAVSTLMGPTLKVEPSEPAGLTTIVCNHFLLSNSTLFYDASYIPTGGAARTGIFKVPAAGGASADVLATGDSVPPPSGYPPNPGLITALSLSEFSLDPSAKLIADYTATYTLNGSPAIVQFNSYPVYGAPQRLAASSCPAVTLPINSGTSVSTDGTAFASFGFGTGTNYMGAQTSMEFIEVGPWPKAGCSAVVFAPDFGSLTGASTYILPGEPVPNTSTPVSKMQMYQVAVSGGVVYLSAAQTLSATQGSYSGIFTVAYNLSNPNGTSGMFPLPNGLWPSNKIPIPTKIISNYDAVPGITLGLATCPGGVSQLPYISSNFAVAGIYLVFTEVQTLQNCTTMATTEVGGIYAYNIGTKTVQIVAPIGSSLVSGDPVLTGFYTPSPGTLSADGHLTFVATTTIPNTSTITGTLYSVYLYQVVTAVSLTAPTTATYGSNITLTAKVSPNTDAANGVAATGTVKFLDGATVLGTQTIDSTGSATFTPSTLSVGSHSFQALYTGDVLYEGASSAVSPLTVAKATPSLTLTSSSTSVALGQPVTLSVQASGTSGYPTGTVTFTSGTTSLGTATLNSTGAASLTIPTLSAGATPVVASSAGDANFNAATSATVTITAGTPDYTITASPTSATISAGGSATFTFTITPLFGFNSPITFSCGTLPSEATCTFAPATVTPTSGPVTSTLTITTTAPTMSRNAMPAAPFLNRTGGGAAGICLAALFVFLPRRPRHKQRWMVFLLAATLSGFLSGCTGAKNTAKSDPGTPKGSATISVSAAAGSGSGATSHVASITVTVQ